MKAMIIVIAQRRPLPVLTQLLGRQRMGQASPGVIERCSGLPQVDGKGLSGLVHAQLGARLDKRFQCSSWGSRPLSQQQARAGTC